MLRQARSRPLCSACTGQLLELFVGGFVSNTARTVPRRRARVAISVPARQLHHARPLLQVKSFVKEETEDQSTEVEDSAATTQSLSVDQQLELKAREARLLYGERLPLDYLSVEEYRIYERLFGPPLQFVQPEDGTEVQPDIEISDKADDLADLSDPNQNKLLKELQDGRLEEVAYTSNLEDLTAEMVEENAMLDAVESASGASPEEVPERNSRDENMSEDLERAKWLAERQLHELQNGQTSSDGNPASLDEEWAYPEEESREDHVRTHPFTSAGRFTTSPRTVSIPALEMTQPIQQHLADNAKYEHLIEASQKIFGGRLLPDSNATPPKNGRHLQQKPVPLAASQFSMSKLDANLFLSIIMPGAYATATSILVEVRKRLGSSWLENLLQREGGPRVLDAGGGGAGVLAWREVLKAEWDRMHEDSGRVAQDELKLGSSTVLAGSKELQSAVSQLLGDTSFIPRLPDFDRSRDIGSAESEARGAKRKQYDVIIAPYSIWQIDEDYMRKNHVQNLWSLLDPDGGVLIFFEKGLPRGFEAIAGARQTLLNHHIRNPQSEVQGVMEAIDHTHTHMEDGMIIAPCTNHSKCPMYTIPGEMVGRQDFCSFSQRFERPPFLQRIHGMRFHNHEDISYSYLAVRRGKDLRKESGLEQNEASTQAAFVGFEESTEAPSMLALPRIMSPPLKRTGHVIFDVCTPQGSFERWVTPKSFSKRAYRDARKSHWGDLWALGAKTRFSQSLNTGRPKGEKSPKIRKALEELGAEGDGLRRLVEKQVNPPTKLKRHDKGWKQKIGRKSKYSNNPRNRKADRAEADELVQ